MLEQLVQNPTTILLFFGLIAATIIGFKVLQTMIGVLVVGITSAGFYIGLALLTNLSLNLELFLLFSGTGMIVYTTLTLIKTGWTTTKIFGKPIAWTAKKSAKQVKKAFNKAKEKFSPSKKVEESQQDTQDVKKTVIEKMDEN